MTSYEIEEILFETASIRDYPDPTGNLSNWSAVYAINNRRDIYVGETGNALIRMIQHRRAPNSSTSMLHGFYSTTPSTASPALTWNRFSFSGSTQAVALPSSTPMTGRITPGELLSSHDSGRSSTNFGGGISSSIR